MKLFSKIKKGLKKGLKALKICFKRNWIGIILCTLILVFIPTPVTIYAVLLIVIFGFGRDTYDNFDK